MLSQILLSAARTPSAPFARFSRSFAAMHSRRCGRMAMVLFAVLLLSAACLSAAAQSFGSVAIGSTSAKRSVELIIHSSATVGSVAVLTQGALDLDFVNAGGGTCKPTTYTGAHKCVVNVVFRPTAAGLRMGAVVLFSGPDNTGTQVANQPIYGIGTGPTISYAPAPLKVIAPTVNGEPLGTPFGLAMDGAGDLYIADWMNARVVEVPAGGGAAIAINPTANGLPLSVPEELAVDGAGDLFITDNTRVVEVPSGGGAAIAIDPIVNGLGLNNAEGLAVNGAGDLFIADWGNSRVVEVAHGGVSAIAIDPTANGVLLTFPQAVAVDAEGDLFIGDFTSRVVEVPANGGAPIAIAPIVNGEGLATIFALAVDAAGDLFVGDSDDNRVVEIPSGSRAPFAIDPTVGGESFNASFGVVLDRAGDLFMADRYNQRVVVLQQSQPPTLIFPTPTIVGQTDTVDPAQTVLVQNSGNIDLNFSALSFPADFSSIGGGPGPCDPETSVEPGNACSISIDFTPKHAGSLAEFVTLTDNNLNETNVQQGVPVDGTGIRSLPGAGLRPTSLTFGKQKVKTASAAKTVTLTNTGAAPLKIHSITIDGKDPKDFRETNKCPASLAPKDSCTLEVIFAPVVKGKLSAKLVIEDNAGNSPQKVSLTGLAYSLDK
jgi:sugar lactone lactonase YvrE